MIGNVIGNVTGNVIGNVIGNVTGNVIGNVTGNDRTRLVCIGSDQSVDDRTERVSDAKLVSPAQ